MDSNLKQLVSRLSNLSISQNKAFFIYQNNFVVGDGKINTVYQKDKKWNAKDIDHAEIFEQAGFKLIRNAKKDKKNYLEVIEKSFHENRNKEKINIETFNLSDDTDENKRLLVEFYNECFIGGGAKNNSSIYNLALLCEKMGYDRLKHIYKINYGTKELKKKEIRKKKDQIKKNLKGAERFK